MIRKFIYIFSFIFLLGCNKPDNNPPVSLPSNLNTALTINEGLVEVEANANNANFYTFTFFEGLDSTVVESTDGLGEYTFCCTGNYTVKTKAHTDYYNYIETVDDITITIDPGFTGGIPTTGYTSPLSYPGYTLVWNDEFDGNTLSSNWVHEIGNGNWGWGNNELEYYREENTSVENGLLVISAKEENFGGKNYTSSRIKTQGIQSFKYGRVDIRAALPFGKGMWPALWMLGDNITSVSWPSCGEIDIMELIGGGSYNDRTIYGTIHWDNNGHADYGSNNSLASGVVYAEEFHVFSIIWTPSSIVWLRDDVQYHVADITPSTLNEFHQNFFFILNVAVGGNWPGSPDATTIFPQTMAVDYIRVFQ